MGGAPRSGPTARWLAAVSERPEDETPQLRAALDAIARGWPVFPCVPIVDGRCGCGKDCGKNAGKHPLSSCAPRGLLDATTDEATIQRWWAFAPNANPAVRTGREAGMFVLDVDTGTGGPESLLVLISEYGPLPDTPTAITGSGGQHYYFAHPGSETKISNSAGKIAPGLDIRGDGGYVLIPPAINGSGPYLWEVLSDLATTPIASPPDWLLDLVTKPREAARSAVSSASQRIDPASILNGVPEGQRNDRLFRYACRLRRQAMVQEEAEVLILEAARNCTPPFDPDEALGCVESAYSRYEAGDGRPQINADEHDLPIIVADAWAALIDDNDFKPRLFQHGGLVRLEHDEHAQPVLRALNRDRLRYELAGCARFTISRSKTDHETGETVTTERTIEPPYSVVDAMLATPDPPLPPLAAIVRSPVFAPNGTLCLDPGYHAAGPLYYDPPTGLSIPAVSPKPSVGEVQRAVELLAFELFGDFSFRDQSDKAAAIAMTIQPFIRAMINGPTPGYLWKAPERGTGKTLGVRAALIPAIGLRTPMTPPPREEEEWRKQGVALLRDAPQAIVFDNCTALFSNWLAATISAETIVARLLGKPDNVTLPVLNVWAFTGNEPDLSRDMSRRLVPVRLIPPIEQPWKRTNFRHPALLEWATCHRAELIWAALTLCANWIANGKPAGTIMMGTFERWAAVLGGVLACAGIERFLDNLPKADDASDGETEAWQQLVAGWHTAHETKTVAAKDLFPLAVDIPGFPLGRDDDERKRRAALGRALKKKAGSIVGGYRICESGKDGSTKAPLYALASPNEAGGSGGSGGSTLSYPRESQSLNEMSIRHARSNPPEPPEPPQSANQPDPLLIDRWAFELDLPADDETFTVASCWHCGTEHDEANDECCDGCQRLRCNLCGACSKTCPTFGLDLVPGFPKSRDFTERNSD